MALNSSATARPAAEAKLSLAAVVDHELLHCCLQCHRLLPTAAPSRRAARPVRQSRSCLAIRAP
eukprot:13130424-Alexandrium_andersonii.AAC.1